MAAGRLTRLFARIAPAVLCGCSLAVSLDGLSGGRPSGTNGAIMPADGAAGSDVSSPADAGANTLADSSVGTLGDTSVGTSGDGGASTAGDSSVSTLGDGGASTAGLIAYYPFDETTGTSASDQSGYGRTANLVGGANFAMGLVNNAVAMNGNGQYVSVPTSLSTGLASFSISTWVYLNSAPTWTRIFDFGTGTNAYMLLTPASDAKTLRFAITVGGNSAEQRLDATGLPTGSWQHVAVTLSGQTGVLYVNGVEVARNPSITLNPASLGNSTHDWLGRSHFSADPYLDGKIDEFRVYDRALSAAEVADQAAPP